MAKQWSCRGRGGDPPKKDMEICGILLYPSPLVGPQLCNFCHVLEPDPGLFLLIVCKYSLHIYLYIYISAHISF